MQHEVAAGDGLGPAGVGGEVGGGERQPVAGVRAGSRFNERTVVRTRWPAASSCWMQCVAMKPEPPVTRTSSPLMARSEGWRESSQGWLLEMQGRDSAPFG
jgi:hypothetical protein